MKTNTIATGISVRASEIMGFRVLPSGGREVDYLRFGKGVLRIFQNRDSGRRRIYPKTCEGEGPLMAEPERSRRGSGWSAVAEKPSSAERQKWVDYGLLHRTKR